MADRISFRFSPPVLRGRQWQVAPRGHHHFCWAAGAAAAVAVVVGGVVLVPVPVPVPLVPDGGAGGGVSGVVERAAATALVVSRGRLGGGVGVDKAVCHLINKERCFHGENEK